jgi:carboxymethylenebutenolidase
MAERFARAGYVCIAPELFHRSAPPGFEGSYSDFSAIIPHYQALTNEGLIADLQASYDWLSAQNPGAPVGTVGWCLGGKVSFLAATSLPVKCAVSYYGGGIAPNQMGPGILDRAPLVQAPLLLHWGGKDGHIGPDQVRAITDALDSAGKAYINAVYSQADHGFNCDARPSYNPEAAKEALALTRAFLELHLAG